MGICRPEQEPYLLKMTLSFQGKRQNSSKCTHNRRSVVPRSLRASSRLGYKREMRHASGATPGRQRAKVESRPKEAGNAKGPGTFIPYLRQVRKNVPYTSTPTTYD